MKYDDDFRTNLFVEMLVDDYKNLYDRHLINKNNQNFHIEDILYEKYILASYEGLLTYYLPESKAHNLIHSIINNIENKKNNTEGMDQE
jgi:hypothetical protein